MSESQERVYLDYNATTPLAPEVLTAVTEALENAWGNPSSSYEAGLKAKKLIEEARGHVATMIGASPADVIFTSGGTEGNNWVLNIAVKFFNSNVKNNTHVGDGKRILPHFVTSNLEHDSIKLVLDHFVKDGIAEVTFVSASHKSGRVEVDDVIAAIRPTTVMITIMMANNETGVIQPISDISEKVHELNRKSSRTSRILLHTDAAQTIGKVKVDVGDLGVDYLTIVGHKFYGPRIGAVYINKPGNKTPAFPLFWGGGQEGNNRPGTENTGMIAGLGKAAELVSLNIEKYERHFRDLRDYLEEGLQRTFVDEVCFNGKFGCSERLPNTCNMSIIGPNCYGHKILSMTKRIQASVGAACHAQNRPSPILIASGIPENTAQNALRLSVGRDTKKEDIDVAVADINEAVRSLQKTE